MLVALLLLFLAVLRLLCCSLVLSLEVETFLLGLMESRDL